MFVQMTKCILDNVSRVLGIDMTAVQPALGVDMAYGLGTCTHSRCGKDLCFHSMCEACATLPNVQTSLYKVEPVYTQRAQMLLLYVLYQ